MPNLYKQVVAIPAADPELFTGELPAGSVAGYAHAILFGQILILSGANMGIWNVNSGAWTKETHAPDISVQAHVAVGDLAGMYTLQPGGTSFTRV